ncbi:MAG TPA: nucleotide sugar dehydrogenase [Chloroflexi bacterium]|nr:nucleotide sugar dehydrogenase [Chloroflexota bacterium]
MKERLLRAIERKSAKIVVLGLGYVGLPVACRFAEVGFRVWGLDRDEEKVRRIGRGECPIEGEEPGLPELVARVMAEKRLTTTTDYAVCRDAQVVLVVVETPVDPETHKPRYEALRGALTSLAAHLSPNTMVIVESTLAPGTMDRLVRPLLEEKSGLRVGEDLYLVHCPERVMPGRLLYNLRHMSRVVGGMPLEAAEVAVALYRHIVEGDLDPTDCLTAELVKTAENAYRDVQIAFANEVALLCETMGADVWRVRELVNKSPGRDMHLPGAGVGGHCIPKDPWLLIANAGERFTPRLIPAARAVNDGMPLHVAELVVDGLREAGVGIEGSRVAVLGYAYRENTDDTRNSPSEVLVRRLREMGAEVVIHDPWVPAYRGDLEERVRGCDAVVVMVAHDEYREMDLERLRRVVRRPVLVDGREVFPVEGVRARGWVCRRIGVGTRRDG